MNEPGALEIEQVTKTKVSIAKYHSLSQEDRMRYLVAELEQTARGNKRGVGRYEALLSIFGLLVTVDQQTTRDLIEMQSIRNVTVHRASIIDHDFVTACPWLDKKLGDSVVVTHEDYHRFEEATMKYRVCLMNRVREHFGLEPNKEDDGD